TSFTYCTGYLSRGLRIPQHRAMRQPEGVADAGFGDRARLHAAAALPIERIAVERVRIERRTGHALRGQRAMKLVARPAHTLRVDAAQKQIPRVGVLLLRHSLKRQ